MRMSKQLLLSRAKKKLKLVEYLDLSNLEIVAIEWLSYCPTLQTLTLRNNHIDIACNLTSCSQLWNIDLGNNRVTNLDGLSMFVALGSLNLSNNSLTWSELRKINHIQILDLYLHGNYKLETDPHYRIHVIDSLPNVWMLDGRIITSNESIQVERFFEETSLSSHPVRRKLTKKQFVPTAMKKIEVDGTYGERTMQLMVRFPRVECRNVDTDVRRIKYLATNLQQDLVLEQEYEEWSYEDNLPCNFLEKLIWFRPNDHQRFNVLLLLLVASLEFAFPTILMENVLQDSRLDKLSNISTIQLFLLPRDVRCRICCLLLSAVKVDRDAKKDDGLHDRLYLCLHYTILDITKRMHASPDTSAKHTSKRIYRQYRGLLAAEIVQLLCIVPSFFEFIKNDPGVKQLVSVACADDDMPEKMSKLMSRVIASGGHTRRLVEEATELLMSAISENTKNVIRHKISSKSPSGYVLSTQEAIPRRPVSSPVYKSHLLAEGRSRSAKLRRQVVGLSPKKIVPTKVPSLGEKVLLGPQNIGFIIALPDTDIALIQTERRQANSGSIISRHNPDDFYSYVDMKAMLFDRNIGYWKPKVAVGNRVTIKGAGETTPSNPPSSPQAGRSPRTSQVCFAVHSRTEARKNIPLSEDLCDKSMEDVNDTSETVRYNKELESSSEPIKDEIVQRLLSTSDNKVDGSEHENSALYDCVKNAVATLNNNKMLSCKTDKTKCGSREVACKQCLLSDGKDGKLEDFRQNATIEKNDKISSAVKGHLTIDLDLRPDCEHTQTQIERIEMWDRSVGQNYNPKKRASSAFARSSAVNSSGHDRKLAASPVMIQMGNSWLAGGRDVHYITKMTNQMKLNHTPGWKQGLKERPQSSKSTTSGRMQNRIRNARSARPRLERVANQQLVPTPASSINDVDACSLDGLSYLQHAHQFTTQRTATPPSYQGQARPPSPLNMIVK